MDWDSWAADIAREDSVVSRGSLRSRSRSPSPLRDASSPVGRLRRVKLPPSRERPLSPTREELVLLSTPHRQQHRRRRRTPPAGRLEPLYVADPNEPPELAAIRRDRAVKGAPGLYGAPAEEIIVQPPRIPSPTHGIENEPSTFSYEGRRKKKKKRLRSRSREPTKPKPTVEVDAWAGARPAYYDQLTSIEHVRDSLPISFLIETGQHKEVLRRRLSYALSIYRRERLYNYRLIWDRWCHGVKFLRSQEFVAKVIVKARHDAINRWYRVLEMSCDLACQRRIRIWHRHMILLRRAERRRIRNAAARVLQKFVRQTLARWAGRRLLFKLKRRREHADACALLTIATFQRQQFRAARLVRSRTLADRSYTNACVIQHRVRLRLARIELARRIRQKQLDREAAAGLTLGKFMHFLKADKSRSNRMSANLVRWREKKLMSKKGALTHEEIAERQSKIDELHAQIAERRRRALELREAKSRELDRMRLVRKDAARAAAAGDGFDDAALAGGDLAAAAEQAELEELRRLEAMLAHEEEMRRLRAEYSPPPPPPLTKPVFMDHSDTSITLKVDFGDNTSIEYNKVGSITHTIDATLLPFFGGTTTIVGLEPATSYVFRLVRNEEKGPVLTAATHQAPEICAVMLQKRVRTWNMRQILVLKRKAREAYLALFYDKCDLLTEMIASTVIIKTWRKVLLYRDWKAAESASADAVALLAKNYLFMLLSDEHKAKAVTRDAAARYEQRIWRDRMRRRLDWHNRTALKIQVALYMWLSRLRVQYVRDEHDAFVRRTSAANVIRHFWHRTLMRRVLALRFQANDLLSESKAQTCAMNAAVCLLRRALERRRSQRYIQRRIDGSRALREVERRRQRRDQAVALISKNYRRHWDRKHTYLRLVAYIQRRNVKKRHAKRDRMSRLVAKHWFAMKWRYNQPLRIIARRRVENNERMCAEVVEQVRRDDAALVFRRAIRRWLDWKYLCRRFDAQRERLDLEETLRERLESAECIQRNWLAYLERCAERARVLALRDRDARREELELQEDAAFQIQRCVQCYLFNRLLELRFQAAAQRLDAEREQRRRVEAARHERRDAEKAQELAEQALKQVELSSWKMGADEEGTNYYYNWVTGESSYEKPEGWYPPAEEVWIKQTDAKGNVYYFNQDTLESAWFPPCMICMRLEAKKVCFSCPDAGADGLFYCNECFEKSHDDEAVEEHNWRGADQDKEELKSGEKHCLVCGKAKASVVCKVCRDEYCDKCFAETHSHGQLKEHPTIPYLEAKQGWQKMVGRVAGEQTYYYNVSTGETRYDKPEEFMLEDELREHHNFLKFQLAAETHAKKVGELQVEVERLQYEKDTTMYNLSKAKTKDQEELEELRRLLMEDQSKLGFMGKYGKLLANPYGYWKEQRDRRLQKRKMYRKMLLLNKREREAAFHDKDTVFAPSEEKVERNSKGLAVVDNLEYKK